MASLENIPPELLLSILSSVDSMVDLHSLISASPRCLSVFRKNRNSILWAVLERTTSPKALAIAIAAVTAPQIPRTALPCDRDKILTRFLNSFVKGDADFFYQLRARVDIVALARNHISVERLIGEYVSEALPLLAACSDPALVDESDDLDESQYGAIDISASERGRLQAAFYVFELYCKVFDRTSSGHEVPISVQCDLLMVWLAPWEIEQQASLLLFFVARLANHFQLVQRQLVTEVIAHAIPENLANATQSVRISTLENTELFDLSSEWSTMIYDDLCGMASRGLSFLGEFTNPRTSPDRRFTLLRKTPGVQNKSLARVLETVRQGRDHELARAVHMDSLESEAPNKFFAQYICTDTWHEASIMSPRRLGLRATGFVFWDQSRIDDMGAQGPLWRTTTRSYAEYKRLRPLQGPLPETLISGLSVSIDTWKILTEKYKCRYYEASEPSDLEQNDSLPSDYSRLWSQDYGSWGDGEDQTATSGGWFELSVPMDPELEITVL